MTAGLPVGLPAWRRVLVSLVLTSTLAACGGGGGGGGDSSESADSRAEPQGLRSASSVDTRKPRVYVTSPLAIRTYRTAKVQITVSGIAQDNVGVTRVTWENDRGGSGEASGTNRWSAAGVGLSPGTNNITVRAYDAAGNTVSARLTAVYTGTTPTVSAPVVSAPVVTPPATEGSDGAATGGGTTTGGGITVPPPPPAPEPVVQEPPPAPEPPPEPVVPNQAPVIAGVPLTTVVSGSAYQFTPVAADPEGQVLIFSVSGLPAWASFNPVNGRLSGTPGAGDVGTTAPIRISVSDGLAQASLPAFSITVNQNASGTATVSWTPPSQRTDGSTLTNLAGYRIRYGTSASALTQTINLPGASLTRYMVEGLTSGTWHFGVVAYDSAGQESEMSNLASKQIL